MLTTTLKKIHLCCVALLALVLSPQAVSGLPDWLPRDADGNLEFGTTRGGPDEEDLGGRSPEESVCVSLTQSYNVTENVTETNFFFGNIFNEDGDGYGNIFFQTIPLDSQFTCTIASGFEGEQLLALQLVAYPFEPTSIPEIFAIRAQAGIGFNYCESLSGEASTGCALNPKQDLVLVGLFYQGPPTTLEVSCSNEPCGVETGFCGDGFCNLFGSFNPDFFDNPFANAILPFDFRNSEELPLNCEQDCGRICGNDICEPQYGEDATNCIRDCYVCPGNETDCTFPPTFPPTIAPTSAPTSGPSSVPTLRPSSGPTLRPSSGPTLVTNAPVTKAPVAAVTQSPTKAPVVEGGFDFLGLVINFIVSLIVSVATTIVFNIFSPDTAAAAETNAAREMEVEAETISDRLLF